MATLDFRSEQSSDFRSVGHPIATALVSTQIAKRFWRISQKLIFKMAVVAAILDF